MASSTRDQRIAFYSTGNLDGSPVLLSGSLGTTAEMWDPQMSKLGSEHWLITFDHRGHGASPMSKGPYTLADLGGDVIQLLDLLGIERVDFAGLSLGGMIGMWLAENAPNRVDRLALLCTYAEPASRASWAERAESVRRIGTESIAAASLERWFTKRFRRDHSELVEKFAEDLLEVSDEGYAGCCEALATMSIGTHLDRIAAPTLVVAGVQDVAAPPEMMRSIAAAIPQAYYAEVDAAHLASVERPEEVGDLLAQHFE